MYVLDRLLALQLGRPMAIHESDFHVILPSRSEKLAFEPDEEKSLSGDNSETLKVSTMDYFLQVIRFSHIVGLVIRELYQPSQIDPSPDNMLLSASALDTSITEWKSNLPRHLRFDLGHTFQKSVTLKRQVRGHPAAATGCQKMASTILTLTAKYACSEVSSPAGTYTPNVFMPSPATTEQQAIYGSTSARQCSDKASREDLYIRGSTNRTPAAQCQRRGEPRT